jgi:hypothetical protein
VVSRPTAVDSWLNDHGTEGLATVVAYKGGDGKHRKAIVEFRREGHLLTETIWVVGPPPAVGSVVSVLYDPHHTKRVKPVATWGR